jgi:thiamine pyrophosphokinase
MRAVIFANGTLNNPEAARRLFKPDDTIIAADGGAHHCAVMGITPALLVGDFDSLSGIEVEDWERKGTELIHHDPRKDETDLELALLIAQGLAREEALVLGALGGRWDQTFANLLLPAYERLEALKVTFWHDGMWVYLVRRQRQIQGVGGQTVSLLPVGGDVHGVTTQGLEWPLQGETLKLGATRGVSNVLVHNRASVSVESGLLLCFVFTDQSKPPGR